MMPNEVVKDSLGEWGSEGNEKEWRQDKTTTLMSV